MTPIQRRDIIRAVRDRWNQQYKDDAQMIGPRGAIERAGNIRARLARLDLETCSVEDVDKAIGVSGWVDNDCDVCGNSFAVVIRIGDEPDYDARWQDLCAGCLAKATAILTETKPLQ